MRQAARIDYRVLVGAQDVRRPLRRRPWRIDCLRGTAEVSPNGDLKAQYETHVIDGFQRAVGQLCYLPILAKFGCDGGQSRRIGYPVQGFAQHAGCVHGRRQAGIALMANDDGSAVECLEAAAGDADALRREAVVREVLYAGADIVDAENQ
jgi:hypothetical protein